MKVAQLVERDLAKVEVAGSNPVFRSATKRLVSRFCCSLKQSSCFTRRDGGIGRHARLKRESSLKWLAVGLILESKRFKMKPTANYRAKNK